MLCQLDNDHLSFSPCISPFQKSKLLNEVSFSENANNSLMLGATFIGVNHGKLVMILPISGQKSACFLPSYRLRSPPKHQNDSRPSYRVCHQPKGVNQQYS
jgi:hypothetical protein